MTHTGHGGRTMAERILSSRCGAEVRAGDVVVCDVDVILGTDGSAPMAIDYFEQMGGVALAHPERVMFALDHYTPSSPADPTHAFHQQVRAFASRTGARVFERGEGISHQLAVERGMVRPGMLVIGADSHTVTCGALNCFAIGVGSSDLAAAMMTGRIWLRVPGTIAINLRGDRPPHVSAKDMALALVGELGSDGANYLAIEMSGTALAGLSLEERLVFTNMLVEAGAKAVLFPFDAVTAAYLAGRGVAGGSPVVPEVGAVYARVLDRDIGVLEPQIARPHAPDRVTTLASAAGTPVHMVFIGTCTGGRVSDFHAALDAFVRGGGAVAPGVQLVLTPASSEVSGRLEEDGTMARFLAAGAIVTPPGCGACCGTSGVIPGDGMTVLSTANRNFRARMGNRTAEIWLASPAACGAAAAAGRIVGTASATPGPDQ